MCVLFRRISVYDEIAPAGYPALLPFGNSTVLIYQKFEPAQKDPIFLSQRRIEFQVPAFFEG